MATQLAAPVTVDTPYGPQEATHEAFGSTDQHEWRGQVQSYRVLGTLDGAGKFIAFPGTEEYIEIQGADLDALLASNASGKAQGQFRNDDVVKLHKEIKSRG
jgi:hypothetical protein